MAQLSSDERERILAALRAGNSQNAVARQFGRSPGTVNTIAREAGLKYSAPKNAAAARRDYCQAERLAFLNEIFDKARELLPTISQPASLQQIALTAAILVDKRRLEDGEVTARNESINTDANRERLVSRFDELAERRRAKTAAG